MTTKTYGWETTAAEVVDGLALSGKRMIVTGGSSGIGVETARALAGAGAEVTLAVRDTAAGERTAAAIEGDVHVAPLDLADQASVRAFAAAWDGPLDVLVMAIQEIERSPEGWEMQFATNHLGHFALALDLHDALAAAGGARIVSVSSAAHLRSPIVWDDIHFRFRDYELWLAYGRSKTANVLFAVEATRRWADDGITANALMPGGITTRLQRHLEPGYMQRRRREGTSRSRRRSRARPPRCCSPPRRTSSGSAAATTRTAARPRWSTGARATPRRASRATRSTRATPSGSGRSRSACSAARTGRRATSTAAG
jgi:NAD(P)-dependent dehydrogenase (short-subunit alcohol dehydrogenase family)